MNRSLPLVNRNLHGVLFPLAMLLAMCAGTGNALSAEKPTVLLFYSDTCEHCLAIRTEFIPGFLATYGDDVTYTELEVSTPAMRDSLYALESRAGVAEQDKAYPTVYFMGTVLEGDAAVAGELEPLVRAALANPDSAWAADREVLARTPERFDAEAFLASKTVHIAYFLKTGCKECGRAEEIVDWAAGLFELVEIDWYDIADRQNKILATALGYRTGVPADRIMSTPMFFVGNDYLLAEDISRTRLADLIAGYADGGAPAYWETFTPEELAAAESSIGDQFRSFALVAVIMAGLGDGINPCAFATILFFVSYLTMVGRRRNEILLVGLSFAFSVFVTYFLVGLGLFAFVQSIADIAVVAKVVFGVTALVCLVFGVISVADYFKARSGRTADMSLQLPGFLKKLIHKTIRERARTEAYIAGALIAGFIISLLELACTGQVYLPTIIFMVGMEGYTTRAALYLLLYNFCFVAPLLLVFGVVYFGVSSQAISRMMEARVGTVKLVLAGVFFTVGALLIWAVVLG